MVKTTQITERMTSNRENFLPATTRSPYSKKDGICTEGAAKVGLQAASPVQVHPKEKRGCNC